MHGARLKNAYRFGSVAFFGVVTGVTSFRSGVAAGLARAAGIVADMAYRPRNCVATRGVDWCCMVPPKLKITLTMFYNAMF
jgi:hypothetical protein